MSARKKNRPVTGRPAVASANTDEELCLIGCNSLSDFIRYVKRRAVNGDELAEGDIAHIWRVAAREHARLQTDETGAADDAQVLEPPRAITAHFNKLRKQPHFQRAFMAVPVALGMVELDKLVACQFEVNGAKVRSLRRSLAGEMTPQALAQICMPMEPPASAFKTLREGPGEFVFQADTHDFRFLGARALGGAEVAAQHFNGFAAGIVALGVGFSTNVLNVVRYGNRMVLNNGYHRVTALRALGVTHAPCIIQVCEFWDDVVQAGMAEISNNGSLYFNSTRPPLLRDYDNPIMTVTYRTWALRKQLRIKIETESLQIRD